MTSARLMLDLPVEEEEELVEACEGNWSPRLGMCLPLPFPLIPLPLLLPFPRPLPFLPLPILPPPLPFPGVIKCLFT